MLFQGEGAGGVNGDNFLKLPFRINYHWVSTLLLLDDFKIFGRLIKFFISFVVFRLINVPHVFTLFSINLTITIRLVLLFWSKTLYRKCMFSDFGLFPCSSAFDVTALQNKLIELFWLFNVWKNSGNFWVFMECKKKSLFTLRQYNLERICIKWPIWLQEN